MVMYCHRHHQLCVLGALLLAASCHTRIIAQSQTMYETSIKGFDGSTVLLEGLEQANEETYVTLLSRGETYANAHLVVMQGTRIGVLALGLVHKHTQFAVSLRACDAVQLELNSKPVHLNTTQWSTFINGLTVNVQLLAPHNATYVVINTSNLTMAITQRGCALDVIAVAAPWLQANTMDGLLASTLHRVDVPPKPPGPASHYAASGLLAHDAPCNRYGDGKTGMATGSGPSGVVKGGPLARLRWGLEMINGPAALATNNTHEDDEEDDDDNEEVEGVGLGDVAARGKEEGRKGGVGKTMGSAFDAAMALAMKQEEQQ